MSKRAVDWTQEKINALADEVDRGVLTKDLGKSAGVSFTPAKEKIIELGLWDEYVVNREARKKLLREKGFDPQSTTEVWDRLVF
jgi:hypothetical protein